MPPLPAMGASIVEVTPVLKAIAVFAAVVFSTPPDAGGKGVAAGLKLETAEGNRPDH